MLNFTVLCSHARPNHEWFGSLKTASTALQAMEKQAKALNWKHREYPTVPISFFPVWLSYGLHELHDHKPPHHLRGQTSSVTCAKMSLLRLFESVGLPNIR